MPIKDLKITIAVDATSGGPQHVESFIVPADATPGLTLTAAQKTKLGDRLVTLASLVDENGSNL
jgi:hypothetical protein